MIITIDDIGIDMLIVVKEDDYYGKLAGWITEIRKQIKKIS